MSKKKKFKDKWSSQTNLGKKFGISAIKVGKILLEYGLKDEETKEATKKALDEGYAKLTPLKDGRNYYMWSIEKVERILAKKQDSLSEIDYWVHEVKEILEKANKLSEEGQDKISVLMCEAAYDEVPKAIRGEVKEKIESESRHEESEEEIISKTPRIQIDHREKNSGLIELLQEKFAQVEVKQLSYADYIINNRVFVERKSAEDFIQSIISQRIFKQCRVLREYANRAVVLIEGDPYGTDFEIDEKAILGAMVSISVSWQIPILFSLSKEETAELFLMIASQDRQEELVVRRGYKPKTWKGRCLFLLQGLPNIGPKAAKNLLCHFQSVENVILAEEHELTKVPGIGAKTARKLRKLITMTPFLS